MSHPADGEHWETDGLDYDHLMMKGDGECDTHDPLPKGKFNSGLPRGTSFWCRSCTHGQECASGGPLVNEDEEDYESDPRLRRVYKFGTM